MGQMKRMSIYDTFCRKQYACLFATDIAARGLGKYIGGNMFVICMFL
jgi:superfamily II DNA/RNA helicase